MQKLFEVNLINNGWMVTEPPIDDEHIPIDNSFHETKKEIEEMLWHITELLCLEQTGFIVKFTVKDTTKTSKKKTYWDDPTPIPMPPVRE